MKSAFSALVLVLFWFSVSCSQTPRATHKAGAMISFETTEHDYGTIQRGSDGTYEFVFKNTGKEPLILKNVRSSCGCTVPSWPKKPIRKGDKGAIRVSYNTRVTGNFSKTITVYSNAGAVPVILRIKGKVEAKE